MNVACESGGSFVCLSPIEWLAYDRNISPAEYTIVSTALLSPLLFHVLVWGALLLVAIGTYMYAMSTRKRATCGSCGEVVQMEHDRVRNCPSCGAPLP